MTAKVRRPFSIFSHPDCTVGAGISPARHLRVRGLYRRYGIAPFPKDIKLKFDAANAANATPQMQKDDSKLSSFLLPLAYTKGGNAGISP